MAHTKHRFVVVGTPLGHTLSPLMHNAAFKAGLVDAHFDAYDPQTAEGFLHFCDDVARAAQSVEKVGGFCVTVPYKRYAHQRCEVLSNAAEQCGAVNVVTRCEGGVLYGDNTDAIGFLRALSAQLLEQSQREILSTDRALIFGTGGAAHAVLYALITAGISEIYVSSRRLEKAEAFIGEMDSCAEDKGVKLRACCGLDGVEEQTFDYVVNATPLGLRADDPLVAPAQWVSRQVKFLYDVVYNKATTTPLIEAARAGCVPCADGRLMLIEQGIAAQEIWNERYHFWDDEETKSRAMCALRNAVIQAKDGENA